MPPKCFESEVESFLEGSHGDRTHNKQRADHHTVTPLCGTLLHYRLCGFEMGVFSALFGCRGVVGFNGCCSGASSGVRGFKFLVIAACRGGTGFICPLPELLGWGCLWPHGCSGRRRPRPPARLGDLTSFGAAPRSPPVPSGPSDALHTCGAWLRRGWRPVGPARVVLR